MDGLLPDLLARLVLLTMRREATREFCGVE
jgi:hypothetical protein